MNMTFAVTITGPETRGMLKHLAAITHKYSARWLESRSIHLEGRVACLLKVLVPEENHQALQKEFQEFAGFHVECHPLNEQDNTTARPVNLSFNANDRPGLVSDIAHVLENLGINLTHIESHRMSVAGLGTNVFTAEMRLLAPEQLDIDLVTTELEKLSDNVLVEVTMQSQ